MKKLLFWMVLIVGIVALIGSCKKDEESTAATTTSVTTTTASGSITVGSETLSGIYATSCLTTGVEALAGVYYPSDTKALRSVYVVTGDAAFSDETYLYSDTSCSTVSAYFMDGLTSLTVGEASGSNYKVTYSESTFKVKVDTTAAKTFYDTLLTTAMGSTIDLTVGTEKSYSSSGSYVNLWYVTSTTIRVGSESTSSTYPTELSSSTMTKQ